MKDHEIGLSRRVVSRRRKDERTDGRTRRMDEQAATRGSITPTAGSARCPACMPNAPFKCLHLDLFELKSVYCSVGESLIGRTYAFESGRLSRGGPRNQ